MDEGDWETRVSAPGDRKPGTRLAFPWWRTGDEELAGRGRKSPHPGKLSAQDVPHRVDLKRCPCVEVVRSFRGTARGEVGCGWNSGDISFSRN